MSKFNINTVKLLFLSLGIFILGLAILIEIPKTITLAQSHILISTSAIDEPNLNPQVAGVETSVQIISHDITPPTFSAQGVIAVDFDSGKILFEKNIHERLLPASTTKIMTALVAVDHYKSADTLSVFPESQVGGSSMGLKIGEKLSFRSILYGMLLNSGNDAAYTIALNYPGGVDGFVLAMNQKATDLSLADTHFDNPAGFDSNQQYSSAYDLSKIALAAALNPEVATVVSTKQTAVSSLDSNTQYYLYNLNKLLNIEGVIGFKTGFTEEAGQNFVGLVERNNHKVITVVLDSQDRFGETKTLMDWVYNNFSWEKVLSH